MYIIYNNINTIPISIVAFFPKECFFSFVQRIWDIENVLVCTYVCIPTFVFSVLYNCTKLLVLQNCCLCSKLLLVRKAKGLN